MNAISRLTLSLLLPLAIVGIGHGAHQAQAAGPATAATLSPTSGSITSDQTQAFTVTATDADGTTRDVSGETSFSTDDPLGSITGATYHAGKVGTWNIQGVYQSFNLTAAITVTSGALAELIINPNSDPEYINLGTKKTFSIRGFDAASNRVEGLRPTWKIDGGIGTIQSNGELTATKLGNGKVIVSVGSVTAEIPVVVKESPVALPVTPTTTNTNAGNQNENTNADVNANTNSSTSPTVTSVGEDCRTLANWVWVVLLIAFILAAAILYALIPVSRIWPVVVGLGGAIILIAVQRLYGCGTMPWWSWALAIATLAMTVFALRQIPMPKQGGVK